MDGHLPERRQGQAQKDMYAEKGVKMLETHATDEQGSVSVEAGIQRLRERMRTHRIKISPHLHDFWSEYRLYHRKDGKIVKSNDHLLDALRYAEMMKRFAETETESEGLLIQPKYIY